MSVQHLHTQSLCPTLPRSPGCVRYLGTLQHVCSKCGDAQKHCTYCTGATCSSSVPLEHISTGLLLWHTCHKAPGQHCWIRLRCQSTSSHNPALLCVTILLAPDVDRHSRTSTDLANLVHLDTTPHSLGDTDLDKST